MLSASNHSQLLRKINTLTVSTNRFQLHYRGADTHNTYTRPGDFGSQRVLENNWLEPASRGPGRAKKRRAKRLEMSRGESNGKLRVNSVQEDVSIGSVSSAFPSTGRPGMYYRPLPALPGQLVYLEEADRRAFPENMSATHLRPREQEMRERTYHEQQQHLQQRYLQQRLQQQPNFQQALFGAQYVRAPSGGGHFKHYRPSIMRVDSERSRYSTVRSSAARVDSGVTAAGHMTFSSEGSEGHPVTSTSSSQGTTLRSRPRSGSSKPNNWILLPASWESGEEEAEPADHRPAYRVVGSGPAVPPRTPGDYTPGHPVSPRRQQQQQQQLYLVPQFLERVVDVGAARARAEGRRAASASAEPGRARPRSSSRPVRPEDFTM